jgi:hypothetical protein
MASTDAEPLPIKNTALRVTFPIFDADGDLVTGAAALDSEVSKDGGTFADCTNEATEIATASGMYFLDLTATEMNADTVAVIVKTSTVGAKTTPLVIYPHAMVEPAATPGWPTDIMSALGFLLAWRKNKATQTATTTTLRNAGDTGTIGTATVSDDGTTYTKGTMS